MPRAAIKSPDIPLAAAIEDLVQADRHHSEARRRGTGRFDAA
jgi:hypothetical protein